MDAKLEILMREERAHKIAAYAKRDERIRRAALADPEMPVKDLVQRFPGCSRGTISGVLRRAGILRVGFGLNARWMKEQPHVE